MILRNIILATGSLLFCLAGHAEIDEFEALINAPLICGGTCTVSYETEKFVWHPDGSYTRVIEAFYGVDGECGGSGDLNDCSCFFDVSSVPGDVIDDEYQVTSTSCESLP